MAARLSASRLLKVTSATADGRRSSSLEAEVIELFDQYRERLLRYLISFGAPVSDGEEIVQEVFLALFQHLQGGKSRRNLRGWLFRVAHNLALKRRYGKHAELEVQGGPAADAVHDPAPSPEETAANNQERARLQAVLHALPEHDQRCLALRAEGLRYREIAEVLDMSLGAVSLSLTRSLARMVRAQER